MRRVGARQVNLGFAESSPLLRRLQRAERATGRSLTRIAREVIEDYLDLWLAARLHERRAIEAARRALTDDARR